MTSSIPYISLFSLTLIMSSIMSLSANQWIYVWMGLELNLLSFIPLITAFSNNRETEAAIKYFLAQAMGSGLLLLGAFNKYMMLEINSTNPLSSQFSSIIIIMMALFIKLGAAPCHFWFPVVMSKLSWPLCIILSTWQKITPLLILSTSNILPNSSMIMFLGSMGSLVGGIGGLNQTQLRPLLAYSSIGHLGWMISTPSLSTLTLYFLIYSLISGSIMLLLWILSTNHWSPKLSINMITPAYSFSLVILILSLAGLPPFLGFLPKWMVLSSIASSNMSVMWPILLITGSTIQLYYYLMLMLTFFMKTSNYMIKPNLNLSSWPQILTLFSTLTLGLSPMIMLMCAMTLFNKS